ncbi:MAG: adenosine deaminase [Acidimicrobiales bacterium]
MAARRRDLRAAVGWHMANTHQQPTPDQVAAAPKVLLHDHLDGGLRVETIIELAAEQGYKDLPTTDPDDLRDWFHRGANRRDLPLYLETFAHTVAVMQNPEALERVAAEAAEDLAADGVVYAELRFAPELHIGGGLSLDEVVDAVQRGFAVGDSQGITVRTLCTAMRTAARSLEIAELAVRHRDNRVVGFDIAGAEAGYPPTRHLDAFQYCHRENFHLTIHAGEAFGPASIWEAIQYCGAERLGHGVRIVDDIDGTDADANLGRLAAFVRDRRIPLELCPTSNVHTGVCDTVADHPIGLLKELRFRITVNTDNRLMSNVSMSSEFQALIDHFDYDLDDLRWITINAMKSAFLPFDERLELINHVIKPAYTDLSG